MVFSDNPPQKATEHNFHYSPYNPDDFQPIKINIIGTNPRSILGILARTGLALNYILNPATQLVDSLSQTTPTTYSLADHNVATVSETSKDVQSDAQNNQSNLFASLPAHTMFIATGNPVSGITITEVSEQTEAAVETQQQKFQFGPEFEVSMPDQIEEVTPAIINGPQGEKIVAYGTFDLTYIDGAGYELHPRIEISRLNANNQVEARFKLGAGQHPKGVFNQVSGEYVIVSWSVESGGPVIGLHRIDSSKIRTSNIGSGLYPDIDIAPESGNITAVWQTSIPGGFGIVYRRFDLSIHNLGSLSGSKLALGIIEDGSRLVYRYEQQPDGRIKTFARWVKDGEPASQEIELAGENPDSTSLLKKGQHAFVAHNPVTGADLVVYQAPNPEIKERQEIMAQLIYESGEVSAPIIIDQGELHSSVRSQMGITFNKRGEGIIFWLGHRAENNGESSVFGARVSPDGTINPAQVLVQEHGKNFFGARVIPFKDGFILVDSKTIDGTLPGESLPRTVTELRYFQVDEESGSLVEVGEPSQVTIEDNETLFAPDVGVDKNGRIIVVMAKRTKPDQDTPAQQSIVGRRVRNFRLSKIPIRPIPIPPPPPEI